MIKHFKIIAISLVPFFTNVQALESNETPSPQFCNWNTIASEPSEYGAKHTKIDFDQFGHDLESSEHLIDNIATAAKTSLSISASTSGKSVSTSYITFQYTSDGWLQHVAVYADSVICTNVAGPREGLQLIVANNGALMDMCHNYTSHKEYDRHKYSWGEVRTYSNHQTVKFK